MAVTSAVCVVVNVRAVAVKLADVAPDGTVIEAGTGSAAALLESVTTAPPDVAALDSVTVHVVVAPGLTFTGLQLS